MVTYVADINNLISVSSSRGKIGEWVRRSSRDWASVVATTAWSTAKVAAKASTAREAAAEAATTSKWSTTATAKATTEASSSAAEAATRGEVASETILADLQWATLPIVTVELLDGVARIVWRLKGNDTRALWTAVRTNVDIGANDSTLASCFPIVSFVDKSMAICQLRKRKRTYPLDGTGPSDLANLQCKGAIAAKLIKVSNTS
jgi:hypothetical protein